MKKQLTPENLRTVKNYALSKQVTPSYIYKLVKSNKMECVTIDGVQFIDLTRHPEIPTK
ncbi:MAG TPA: hypothetical protein VK808_03175 [Bacteroidia bacterium]|nr:hypothetical protein [Bacteroidia bacterium]